MKALLQIICFIIKGAKYQQIKAVRRIGTIIVTHNPITKISAVD